MNKKTSLGRLLFAISMAAFGVLQFVSSDFVPGLVLIPTSIPGRQYWAYIIGAFLIAMGISVMFSKVAPLGALITTIFWSLCFLLLQLPKLAFQLTNGGLWTTAFEVLAICGGALVLAATLPNQKSERTSAKAALIGRVLFAISLPVFGVLHFKYVDYVALVQPAWIPGHVFWAYFTGVAHIAAGLSILTGVKARLAAIMLAIMFGLWVLILHIPRALAGSRPANEWASTIIALAMCASSLLIAGSLNRAERSAQPQQSI